MRRIAVIDVGKTNAKLALVDLADLSEITVRTRPNQVLQTGPYPHYDLEGHWQFFCQGLQEFQRDFGVDGISITTHGAAATLIGHDGQALPMLDYEHTGPDDLAVAYAAIRPDFAQSGSPCLPMGLNLGAQLHWQFATDPSLRAKVKHIVTYPQYWGHRLTDGLACDLCSLGCHTDLWLPDKAQFSGLVDHLGIRDMLASPRRPAEILGGVSQQAALQTGLREGLPVAVGIHDSNASLYPHLLAREGAFSVVSTGTWVIIMAMRGDTKPLDPARDTLININGLGEAVPSARFMGGREFDLINQGWTGEATEADRDAVYAQSIMLLPAVESASGPFSGQKMRWTVEPKTQGQRKVALSNYLALMTHTGLKMIGAKGPCVVEGPFARNPDYLSMIVPLCPEGVEPKTSATGTSIGAALLFGQSTSTMSPPQRLSGDKRHPQYARDWNNLASSGQTHTSTKASNLEP